MQTTERGTRMTRSTKHFGAFTVFQQRENRHSNEGILDGIQAGWNIRHTGILTGIIRYVLHT